MYEILITSAIIGMFFNTLGIIGLFRFPDVYTRLHAATKCTTFGTIFIAISVIVYGLSMKFKGYAAFGDMSLHAFFALAALLMTNPTGAHAIARAAHKSGVKPIAVVDKLEEENDRN